MAHLFLHSYAPFFDFEFLKAAAAECWHPHAVLLFLFLIEIIGWEPSSEPSQRDDSDEGYNLCFYTELRKIILNYRQILVLI